MPETSALELLLERGRAVEHLGGGLLHPLKLLRRVLVRALARLARAARGVLGHAPRLLVGVLLDLGRALLGGLHDLAHLLGGGARHAGRGGLELGLQLGDRVGELAQVKVDLLLLVAAPGHGEVLALDVVTIQLHASSRRRSGPQRSGHPARTRAAALASQQTAQSSRARAEAAYET